MTPQNDALITIQQALNAASLPIFGIAQSRPSLDDVYLAATGRTLLDAEIAAVANRDPKAEKKQNMRWGEWGLGIGDWGLGKNFFNPNLEYLILNPQSLVPNP